MTEPTRGPGRPSKLTPEVSERILQVMRAGNYRTVAAQFAGASITSVNHWITRGRNAEAAAQRGETVPPEEERYRTFAAAVAQAEVHSEVVAATAFRAAVTDDWRAARDYLRYRVPDRWHVSSTLTLRPEEAEQRIDRAVSEALGTLGIANPAAPPPPDDDTAALLSELTDDDGLNLGPPRHRPEPGPDEEDTP